MIKNLVKLVLIFAVVGMYASAQTTISSVYVKSSTSTTATIVWTTSTASTSQVKYGLDSSIHYANSVNYTMATSHSMTLTYLNSNQPYYFAVVSVDTSGNSAQSSTYEFALCGKPNVPVSGTINQFYYGGTYSMAWNPPSGSSGTSTVCGSSLSTPVAGSLNLSGSFSAQVADSLKVTPGPGTWTITVQDIGDISPISVTLPISATTQDISSQLQAVATSLVGVIANNSTDTVYPPFLSTARGTAGGDLSGSYPDPTVVQVNGAAVPVSKTVVGTNSLGQIIDASGATLSNNTTGNSATTTALSSTPTLCSTGYAPTGIDANGNVVGCAALGTGTVTSFSASSASWPAWLVPTVSNAATTPSLSVSVGSQTANYFLASPNGVAGVPSFRAIVAADIPTLNQSTTGTAANITATSNGTITTLSALTSASSLATVGTITSGVWNGTAIANTYLANPSTTVNGMTCTLGSSCTVTASPSVAVNLASSGAGGVTGTLPVANGGTGATTATSALSNLGAIPLSGGTMTGALTDSYGFIGPLTGNASTSTTSTNLSSGVLGSVPYQSAANTTAMLAPNTTTTKLFYTQTGTGSAGSAPIWAGIVSADIATALTTPGPIGSTTPNTGAFTTLTAKTSLLSGSVQGVLNAASCGYTNAPSWCSGSDIGAWVNAAASQLGGSGTIYIPDGTYTWATPIVLVSGSSNYKIALNCSSRATILNFTGTGSSSYNNAALAISGEQKPEVSNCQFVGTSATSGTTGIYLHDSYESTFRSIIVSGFPSTNFVGVGAIDTRIYSSDFASSASGWGLKWAPDTVNSVGSNGNSMIGGTLQYNGAGNFWDAGISASYGGDEQNTLDHVTMELNAASELQFLIEGTTSDSIENSYIENFGTATANAFTGVVGNYTGSGYGSSTAYTAFNFSFKKNFVASPLKGSYSTATIFALNTSGLDVDTIQDYGNPNYTISFYAGGTNAYPTTENLINANWATATYLDPPTNGKLYQLEGQSVLAGQYEPSSSGIITGLGSGTWVNGAFKVTGALTNTYLTPTSTDFLSVTSAGAYTDSGVTAAFPAGTAFTFANSWANYGGLASVATYRLDRGQVYLTGLIHAGTAATVTTLGSSYYPLHNLYFIADAYGSALDTCEVVVTTTGIVSVTNYSTCATTYVSLDGISYATN